jgi:hypothetical protein
MRAPCCSAHSTTTNTSSTECSIAGAGAFKQNEASVIRVIGINLSLAQILGGASNSSAPKPVGHRPRRGGMSRKGSAEYAGEQARKNSWQEGGESDANHSFLCLLWANRCVRCCGT